MDIIKKQYNQEYVDNLVSEAQEQANKCQSEEDAMELLRNLCHLHTLSKFFFVPEIVLYWEEMALSYVESDAAVFEFVYHPEMTRIYNDGITALTHIETAVENDLAPKDVLFKLMYNFNKDILEFNKNCKKYQCDLFPVFQLQSNVLHTEYQEEFFGDKNG